MVTVVDNKPKPRHPEKAHRPDTPILKKPEWIRVKAPGSAVYAETQKIVRENKLVTVFLVQHAGWSGDGKNILPTFKKAATAAFGLKGKASAPTLIIGINSAPVSFLKPKETK